MSELDDILKRMEKLSFHDLQRLNRYISTQPYKLEDRKPTPREQTQLITDIRRFIDECDDDEESRVHTDVINAALHDMNRTR